MDKKSDVVKREFDMSNWWAIKLRKEKNTPWPNDPYKLNDKLRLKQK